LLDFNVCRLGHSFEEFWLDLGRDADAYVVDDAQADEDAASQRLADSFKNAEKRKEWPVGSQLESFLRLCIGSQLAGWAAARREEETEAAFQRQMRRMNLPAAAAEIETEARKLAREEKRRVAQEESDRALNHLISGMKKGGGRLPADLQCRVPTRE
jgi:hypothetical protein